MRRWKPKKPSPLPNPSDEFTELEAARAWGYTLSEWQAESAANRARCMASWMFSNMRENFIGEKSSGDGDKNAKNYNNLLSKMGIE